MIESTEFDLDVALVWGVSEYNSKDVNTESKKDDEYILIDNPINRIKDVKY